MVTPSQDVSNHETITHFNGKNQTVKTMMTHFERKHLTVTTVMTHFEVQHLGKSHTSKACSWTVIGFATTDRIFVLLRIFTRRLWALFSVTKNPVLNNLLVGFSGLLFGLFLETRQIKNPAEPSPSFKYGCLMGIVSSWESRGGKQWYNCFLENVVLFLSQGAEQ